MPEVYLNRCRVEDEHVLEDDVRRILSTDYGRRVLCALLGKAGVFGYVGDCQGESVVIAYRTGRRDAALEVLRVCNRVAAGLVLQGQQERAELNETRKLHYEMLVKQKQEKEKGR